MSRVGYLFSEFRRRKIFRSLGLYVGSAWVVLQGAGLAFPGLRIPEEAIRYVWIGAITGLPLALLFAWRYQITAEGIVRTAPSDAEDSADLSLGTGDYVLLGAILFLAGLVTVQVVDRIRDVPPMTRLAATGEIPSNSIAVLPLENVTGDPEQEYFAAGMHDALITTLSEIGALIVKARSSTRRYANVVQPVRQTGIELGAAHLIEGSVFRTGGRVRINVRLIDSGSEESLWSESYERSIEDVLTLQAEVARAIAEQVQVEITPDEERRLTSASKVNPDVYETYLRGMYHLNQYTPEGVKRGLALLHQAVEMDPEDPLAYAGLALGYTMVGHSADPPPGAFRQARESAVKALELDPLFPEAHAAMAEIQLYYDWDWEGAERSFRRALQLNPNLEFAHAHYGWYHALTGDLEAAIERMERAQQIAPVTPIFTAWLGWLHWNGGHLDRAVAEAQKALELNPGFTWGLHVLGGVYAEKGMYEEALAVHRRLVEVSPNVGRWGLGRTYALMGREEDSRRVLGELAEDPGQKDLIYLGVINAVLGDDNEALGWLEAARENHVDWFPWIGAAAARRGDLARLQALLGDDPRFDRLVEALDLPAAD